MNITSAKYGFENECIIAIIDGVTFTGDVHINPRGMHARFDHANLGALHRPHFLLTKSDAPFGFMDFNAEI